MPRQQLQDALDALHQELESGHEMGEEDHKALLQAATEIQDALGKPTQDAALSDRVSGLIEEFEASHPRFAELLANVSEALANLGI